MKRYKRGLNVSCNLIVKYHAHAIYNFVATKNHIFSTVRYLPTAGDCGSLLRRYQSFYHSLSNSNNLHAYKRHNDIVVKEMESKFYLYV